MSLRSSVPDPLVGPARRVRDAVRDATAGQRSGWAASRRRRRVEAKEVVIGFGHPVYTVSDPRNVVIKEVARRRHVAHFGYAWRPTAVPQPRKAPQGLALQWWLQQLDSPATRKALLEHHASAPAGAVD